EQDRLEQLAGGELRVEQEGDVDLGAEAAQQGAAQRRLARPDLAGHGDEALALLDAVEQVREGLAMGGREEQEARVRAQRERLLPEPEERGIHGEIRSAREATSPGNP